MRCLQPICEFAAPANTKCMYARGALKNLGCSLRVWKWLFYFIIAELLGLIHEYLYQLSCWYVFSTLLFSVGCQMWLWWRFGTKKSILQKVTFIMHALKSHYVLWLNSFLVYTVDCGWGNLHLCHLRNKWWVFSCVTVNMQNPHFNKKAYLSDHV